MKQDESVSQLGGVFAALVALGHLLLGGTRLFGDLDVSNLWQGFLQAPGPGRVILLTIMLLMLAVVPAVERLFGVTRALANWLSQLAFLGLMVSALARVQDSSVDVLFYSVDPKGWLGLGCLVVWAGGIGFLGWRRGILPPWLNLAGVAWAALLVIAMVGGMYWNDAVVWWALLFLCFAVAPVWFGGLAQHLLREAAEAKG